MQQRKEKRAQCGRNRKGDRKVGEGHSRHNREQKNIAEKRKKRKRPWEESGYRTGSGKGRETQELCRYICCHAHLSKVVAI